MADDGRLFLELYPLKENAPFGNLQQEKATKLDQDDVMADDNQKGKESEMDDDKTEAGEVNQDDSSAEVLGQSEPQMIYVDREIAVVILRASLRDLLQITGVNNSKLDRGEVVEIYDDGSVQLKLLDKVSGTQ